MSRKSAPEPSDIAQPQSFEARYGAGLDRGLSLGGGGLFFIAWQLAYLSGLAAEGVDLGIADRVVGTSAGSVVGTILLSERLGRVYQQVGLLARLPALVNLLAKAADLSPSQQRAWDLFEAAQDAAPETLKSIGYAALAADTPSQASARRSLSVLVGRRSWPSERLHISCVDAYTAERCIITDRTRVSTLAATAASTALPGIYPPQKIGQRFCMDGGVSGSAIHLDLLAGARRTLVLALLDGSESDVPAMTFVPGGTRAEIEQLAATGTDVEVRLPESVDLDEIMLPSALPKAIKMGHRQAAADAPALRSFWA